jgi:anhydro-N-acetylmuramic acid kinase
MLLIEWKTNVIFKLKLLSLQYTKMAEKTNEYRVIGLMSGTSLDGLDIAYCLFTERNGAWSYSIEQAEMIPYTPAYREQLNGAGKLEGQALTLLNNEFGLLLGNAVNSFCKKLNITPQLISSHGHTVFHQPAKKMTLQIGSGAVIAAKTGIPTVCDFRSKDVALGGQAAPLVPIGDKLLFGDYASCLNLGGFANISFDKENKRVSFDVCPVNIVVNQLCRTIDKEYDENGNIAHSGSVHPPLLSELEALPYYQLSFPKSLGKEWVEEQITPILQKHNIPLQDALRTFYEHIAQRVAMSGGPNGKLLVTGGGAHNSFLIELIRKQWKGELVVPDAKTVDFKEALIFAFLGVLRLRGEYNSLASVTGANKDSIGGALYL